MSNEKRVIDFRKRKFFRATRSILDNEDNGLIQVDLVVYYVLCMFADNNDASSYPSIETIRLKARCSERTVSRSLKSLKDAGYIRVDSRKDSRGFKISNLYTLLDVDE